MGKVIRLPNDPHRETQLLLPWYAAGRLDGEERARIEAHLRTCARCRSELAGEQRLGAEVANLPLDADLGWASMLRRIEESEASAPTRGLGGLMRAGAAWAGWAAAACVSLALVGGALIHRNAPATYQTLSAPTPAAAPGNAIVVFRPEASEAAIAAALSATHARIIDGPTGADAYVLRISAAERDASVAKLRTLPSVEMAEPIDGPGSP
jgi:hypothetical protein